MAASHLPVLQIAAKKYKLANATSKKMIRSPNTSFLPTLPLLLLLFLLTAQAAQPRFLAQTCNSSCGELTGITYPFRLTTDPQGCGDTDYEISCENDKPTLQFHSGKYHVRRISYGSRTIRVVDPSFFAANGTCIGLPSQSLSVMELNEDSRYRGFASNIETSFVRCSGNITIQSYRRVPCLSDDDGLNSVYVSYGTYIISGLKGPCSFLARVPTIYQAVMGPSYENIMLLLQEGFDLGWSVECRDCLARGHECVMTGYDTPFTYECRSPEYYVYGVVSFFAGFLSSVFFDVTLVARFVLAPMVVFGFLIHKYRTTQKSTVTEMVVAKGKFVAVSNSSLVARRYSYADIVAMTDQFRDKIGRGRFGTVFKGKLPDGGLVAVKVLGDPIKLAGEGFVNEINVIARVHHNNVVRLLGVCSEGSHNVLVLDYMPNGSLDKYIASREEGTKFQPLSLEQLLQVALGTARGIRHLHEGCDSCILHMDIKSQNVLLDHGFVPKVTDFGLSKFHNKEGKDSFSMGTPRADLRYVAPEVLSNGLGDVLCRSDVYSFGMLLLEMVEGKWLAESKGKSSSQVYFPMWVYDHLSEGGDLELQNVTQLESAIARKLCVVGLWCIQKSVSQRPLMAKVVEMLETNGDHLQLPPNSFCFPEHVSAKDLQSDSSRQLLIPESVEPSS